MKDAAIVIENDSIVDVIFRDELSYKYSPDFIEAVAEKTHEYGEAIITPGLINLHTHLDYSALHAFNVEAGMFDWICDLVARAAKWKPEQWRESALYGARQAALAGTSCIVDSSFTGLSVHAIAKVGLRAFVGLELFGLRDDEANAVWGQWLAKYDSLRNTPESASRVAMATEKIRLTVAPHAPYTVCPTLWLKATTWAQEKALPLLAHLCESEAECQWIRSDNRRIDEYLTFVKKMYRPDIAIADSGVLEELSLIRWKNRGQSPVKHLKNFGLLDENLVAAHAVHTDDEDLRILAEAQAKIAHCPRSNARLRNGRAKAEKFAEKKIPFGLGTDGLGSNDDLDLLKEARFAASVHRAAVPDFQWNSEQIFSAITLDAARLLNISQEVGSLESGKQADIAVFKFDEAHTGSDNPYDLLLHGDARVSDLFVDGDRIVGGGELVEK